MLPERTESLLRVIDACGSAQDLLLVGDTALALRTAHRKSADLDFVFTVPRLPRRKIASLLEELRPNHDVTPMPNVAAEDEFLDSGLELADYQQDYSVDGIKVTFFTPDPSSLGKVLRGESGFAGLKRIRVADLDSLFVMKAVTLNSRITARDLFDVYTLVRKHGYREADIFRHARQFDFSPDTLKARLRHATRRLDDPGIETPDGAPPAFEQLKAFFVEAINRVEQQDAADAIRRQLKDADSASPASKRPRGGRRKTSRRT